MSVFAALLCSWALQLDTPPAKGKMLHDFTLQQAGGAMYSTAQQSSLKGLVVVFTCNHCPFARLYTQRLNHLARRCDTSGMKLLAINSMDTLVYEDETLLEMQKRAKEETFQFPYLQDPEQQVAKMMGAGCTPQAFILWKERGTWVLLYSGAIDNNGQEPEHAVSYVGAALDDLLSGRMVRTPYTQAFGCKIYYRNNDD
jgi:peroxiredoxin